MGKYGAFQMDGMEYRVDVKDPIHVIDNFVWNDNVFGSLTQTGTGYLSYDHSGREITNITHAANDCEEAYEHYYNRLLYIRDNETGQVWNVNWEPALTELDGYGCVHGLGYTTFSARKDGIAAGMRVFVPPGKDALEVWSLTLTHQKGPARDLSVFAYNGLSLKSTFTYGEGIYIKGEYQEDVNGVLVRKDCEFLPHDVHTAFLVCDRPVARYDCSRGGFFGPHGTHEQPGAVLAGRCGNTVATGERPIAVLQMNVKLRPGSSYEANFLLGIAGNTAAVKRYRKKYFAPGGIPRAFDRLAKNRRAMVRINAVETPDQHLNMLMNIWHKHQIEFGATWGRWGFRGYRDVVQHNMARALLAPDAAADTLLKALRHQYSDGSALRGWSPIDTKPYADSALWLVYAVTKYLKESGNLAFLKHKVAFYDQGAATVQEHLCRAVTFCWNNRGADGLCLTKFGDWNDSLTRVAVEGKGQSVWLTMALSRALVEMKDLANHLGDKKLATTCARRHRIVVDTINDAAWEGDRYIRCIDDNGRPVGSKKNKQGRVYLNAQSWGALSYAADEERFATALATVDKTLLTPLGYKLLDPTYTRYDPHIGRITSMQPGIAENGTIYAHGNAFMMLACLQMGRADQAYDIYQRVMTCYEKMPQHVTGAVPYTVQNACNGPDHHARPFRVEYSWVTGSVGWFYLAVLEWLLGARSEYAGLRIDPRLPKTWRTCRITRHFRGKVFDIRIRRTKGITDTQVTLNGSALKGSLIDPDTCPHRNMVRVLVG